jgi:Tfp pilus assembly protein PilO
MTDLRRIVQENRRIVYILAAALVINAALYALVVYPLAQRVASGEQEAGESTRALVAARKTFDSARGTVSGKKEADAELVKFYEEVLPPDLSGARRVLYPRLDQLARKTNLTPGAYRFHPEESERTGDLRKITMTMNLTGEYTNIRRFIHELETAPEFLVLESVAVTTTAEGDRRLNVVAQIGTYYRAPAHGN